MCDVIKDFKVKKGDTFDELQLELVQSIDNAPDTPVDLTGAEILMQLRKTAGGEVALEFSTANAKIEITDAALGKFKIKTETINIPAYVYKQDLQITFADETVRTYWEGIFNVTEDISA